MDDWNTTFLLGKPIFRGYKEGNIPFEELSSMLQPVIGRIPEPFGCFVDSPTPMIVRYYPPGN